MKVFFVGKIKVFKEFLIFELFYVKFSYLKIFLF